MVMWWLMLCIGHCNYNLAEIAVGWGVDEAIK